MRENAPAGWKGDDTREKQVLNALFPIMCTGPRGDAGHFRDHQEPARLLMSETIQLGDISIEVTRKDIKHVHLSVHPPDGRVTLSRPAERGSRLRGPTRSPSSAGFGSSRRSCADRRGKRRGSLSSAKAIISGGGATC